MVEVVDHAATLIGIAHEAIARPEPPAPRQSWPEAWLAERGASFVTLRLDGELRGCIGTIDAHRALGDDVAHNAFAAAFRDPRFEPVSDAELGRLVVEVSVLGPRVPMNVATEAEALAAMRPGIAYVTAVRPYRLSSGATTIHRLASASSKQSITRRGPG